MTSIGFCDNSGRQLDVERLVVKLPIPSGIPEGIGRKPRTEVHMKHGTKKQSDKDREHEQLDALFSRLRVASKRLNMAGQDAGKRIQALEERLADAEPGIAVWGETLLTEQTTFRREEGHAAEAAERVVTLGFAKVKKDKWGIAVREVIKGANGEILSEETSLLSRAERALRLLALPHLESLTRQLVEAVEAQAAVLPDAEEDDAEKHTLVIGDSTKSAQN